MNRSKVVALPKSMMLMLFFGLVGVLLGQPAARAQATGAAPSAQNGKQVFTMQGCVKCHGDEGQGLSTSERQDAGPRIGPPRLALPAFLNAVRNPTGQMQPFGAAQVSDAALTDVYAFLQSFARNPQADAALAAAGNAQSGQHLFHDYGCYQCHGDQGQGSFQTGASRIGPPQIDFSSFLSYVRQPTNQMPPYTSKAAPDAQMADIYAYLKSIPVAPAAKNIPLLNQ